MYALSDVSRDGGTACKTQFGVSGGSHCGNMLREANMTKQKISYVLALTATFAFACGSDDGDSQADAAVGVADAMPSQVDAMIAAPDATSAALETIGTWNDEFIGETIVTETQWGASAVIEYDNDSNTAILQWPADDMFNPNKFGRYQWTEIEGDVFHYCTVVFGKETAQEAIDDPATADSSDLATGCSGFSWSKMTRIP